MDTSTSQTLFESALDRFAQCFIHPLFSNEALERAVVAIESQHALMSQSDIVRLQQVMKSVTCKQHPYHQLSTGNMKTLQHEAKNKGINLQDEMSKFYNTFYSSRNMKLVVLGREPLDILESYVINSFADVRDHETPEQPWMNINPFPPECLRKQIFARPLEETSFLRLSFPFPNEGLLYESKPRKYIEKAITHRGPGSILASLQASGWANDIVVVPANSLREPASFDIVVDLTEGGVPHYVEIIKAIFRYVAFLQEGRPNEAFMDQITSLTNLALQFKQKSATAFFLTKTAENMHGPYPPHRVLVGEEKIWKNDSEAIARGLCALNLQNVNIMLVSKQLSDLNVTEPWYGTQYRIEDISTSMLEDIERSVSDSMTTTFQLPRDNKFIPSNFIIQTGKNGVQSEPRKVIDDEDVRVWFKEGSIYNLPEAHINAVFRKIFIQSSPVAYASALVYCEMIRDRLSSTIGEAQEAGLHLVIDVCEYGLSVSISGYSHKILVLLKDVAQAMENSDFQKDELDKAKENVIKSSNSRLAYPPILQNRRIMSSLLRRYSWTEQQIIEETRHIEMSHIIKFMDEYLCQSFIEMLVNGNLREGDAIKASQILKGKFGVASPEDKHELQQDIILEEGCDSFYRHCNPINKENCIEYYMQICSRTDRNLPAKLLLFEYLTRQPAEECLKIQEQLGYCVLTGIRRFDDMMGYRLSIQSTKECAHLNERIEKFLLSFGEWLRSTSDRDFENFKNALISSLLETPINLQAETFKFWEEILHGSPEFSSDSTDAVAVKALDKQAIISFYEELISPNSPKRMKLSLYNIAGDDMMVDDPAPGEIVDLSSFKQERLLSHPTSLNKSG